MTDADAEKIGISVARAMQQARSVSDSEHYDHHRWISERIDKEKARKLFWEKMYEHAMKWGMLSVFSGLFYALWLGFRTWAKANGVEP